MYLSELRAEAIWVTCYDKRTKRVTCGPGCTEPTTIAGVSYPMCPELWRSDPRWRTIVELYNASKVSPLHRWPDAYHLWVRYGLGCLEAAFVDRHATEAKTPPPGVNSGSAG